jgi:hypothetical protein
MNDVVADELDAARTGDPNNALAGATRSLPLFLQLVRFSFAAAMPNFTPI